MDEEQMYIKCEEAKDPEYQTPLFPVSEKIKNYLAEKNIQLYTHQADTFDHVLEGKNVIITTPTASGKTLAYALPVFEGLIKNPEATALFIYPTKALTRDQLLFLKSLDADLRARTKPAIYDGDTRQELRSKIRSTSRIILTNMYELHHILAWRAKWGDFWANLSYVVVDEAHRYRGIFGSNTALLLRRLRRVCNYYDADPQFLLSSATLGNAGTFAETLTSLPFVEIDNDGSPRAKRTFRIYSPQNKSSISAAAELVTAQMQAGMQTLCFTRSRKAAEITAIRCREEQPAGKIASYRGGYRPAERREIESALKMGSMSGVISTNALEVGIDVGGLDSVVISGFPGSMISVLQQAGRAGRNRKDALITFIAGQNPIDQYYARNPEAFFNAPQEEVILGIHNPYLLSSHLLCAAAELPYRVERDRQYFGEAAADILESLKDAHLLASTSKGYVYCGGDNPAQNTPFFGIDAASWSVRYENTTLETMDENQAYREAYFGAVIFHQGERYRVETIDADLRIIRVVKTSDIYSTRPIIRTEISITSREKTRRHHNLIVNYGEVQVSSHLCGYSVIEYDQIVTSCELDAAPRQFTTKACWITIDEECGIAADAFPGSLHGAEHALIAAMPHYVLCDRSDIGGLSTPFHNDTLAPTIFMYDGVKGGIGLAEKAADLFADILTFARELVTGCPCTDGCPSCIHSPKCGNNNQPLNKAGTAELLEYLEGESKKPLSINNPDVNSYYRFQP
jgi:DEAD/DEAH box helicase domain-containing protein